MPYKDPEKLKAYKREWARKNYDRYKDQVHQYYRDNIDKIKEYQKEYREKNREKYNIYHREWNKKNRKKISKKESERKRRWKEKNPEKYRQKLYDTKIKCLKAWWTILEKHFGEIKCQVCGFKGNFACFDFHHRNPKDKKIGGLSSRLHSTLPFYEPGKKLMEEIKKCDLLCRNCHSNLHSKVKWPLGENNNA